MGLSCNDVCDIVIDRLLSLGLDIDTDDEDHTDIIEALYDVTFVKDEELKILKHSHKVLHKM